MLSGSTIKSFRVGDVVAWEGRGEGTIVAIEGAVASVEWRSRPFTGLGGDRLYTHGLSRLDVLRRPVEVGDVLRWHNGVGVSGDRRVGRIDAQRIFNVDGWCICTWGELQAHAAAGNLTHADGTPIEVPLGKHARPPKPSPTDTPQAALQAKELPVEHRRSVAFQLFATDPRVVEFLDRVSESKRDPHGPASDVARLHERRTRALHTAWERHEPKFEDGTNARSAAEARAAEMEVVAKVLYV